MAKIYGRESAAKRNKGKVYKAGTGFINRDKEEKETKPFSSGADIYEKQHIKQLENTVNKLNKSTVKDDKWQAKYDNAVKTLETAKKRAEEKKNNPYTSKVNKKIKAVENNASSIFDVSIKNTEKKVKEADEDALSAIFELDRQRKADMGAINSRIYGSDASAYNLEDINKQMEAMHKNEQENMAKVESKNNTAMAASARLSDLRLDKKEYADKNKTKVYTTSAKEDKNFANDANSGEKLFEAEKAKNITTDKGMLLTGLNEKEKRIYSYYLTKDKELADDYLDSIADTVNTRAAKITYNAYKDKSAEADKKIEDIDNEYVKFLAKNSKAAAEDIGEGTVSFMSGYQKAGQGFRDFGNMITGNGKTTNENAVQKVQQLIRQDQTGVEAVINDILYSTGNMLPAMLVSVATGGAGAPALATSIASAATTFASSSGNSYADAVKAGQDVSDAVTYGVISGASEALLQYGLSGINKLAGGKITGALKSKINNVIGKLSKSKAARKALTALADNFADAGGEALEEYLQTVLEPVFRDMVFGETNKREPFSEEALYSAMLGALSSAMINTATGDRVKPLIEIYREIKIRNEFMDWAVKSIKGELPTEQIIKIRDTPEILQRYGASSLDLKISQSGIRKIVYPKEYMGGKHNLGFYALEQLPAQLEDPIAILKSNTQNDSIVVVTEFLDENNYPVIIPIHLNSQGVAEIYNKVPTMYGRGRYNKFIENQDKEGNILYVKENRDISQLPREGLQLPDMVAKKDPIFNYSISRKNKNMQYSVKEVGEAIKSNGTQTIQSLIRLNSETGGRISKNSLAGKIDAKLKNGEEISANEIGRLAKAVNKNLAKMEAEQFNTPLWDNLLGKDAMQAIKELSYESDFGAVTEALYGMENNRKSNAKFVIVTAPNGKKYVKADRQVIKGSDPKQWAEDVENYINNEIRNGRDVKVMGSDGEILTITSNTAGKATFRNEVKIPGQKPRKMTDAEYAAKLRAETHIDELADVSIGERDKVTNTIKLKPDKKNHPFATDGFNYRTAYFEDEDGKYYRIDMSVGYNGDIKTIYNVGKMIKSKKTLSSVAQRPSGKLPRTESVSVDNIPQSDNYVNNNIRKNEKNDTIKEKGENGNEILSYGSGERNDGKRTGGQIIRVDESARGIEERVEFIERIREEGRYEKRIEEDLEQKTEYSEIIAEDIPESLKNLKEQFDAYGLHVRFSLDEIKITDKDGIVHYAAGLYENGNVVLSVNRIDLEKNARHEFLHAMAERNKEAFRTLRTEVLAAMTAEEKQANIDRLKKAYKGISNNTTEIIEELVANVYAGQISVSNAEAVNRAISGFEDGISDNNLVAKVDNDVVKLSILTDKITKEEIDNNRKKVLKMKSVSQIGSNYTLPEGKNLMERVVTAIGTGTVKNKYIGEIGITKSGIAYDFHHGYGKEKINSIPAIKNVLRKGVPVDMNKNWEGRGYDTVLLAAPIEMGKDKYIMGARVKTTNDYTQFELHEVVIQKITTSEPFTNETIRESEVTRGSNGGYTKSILQSIINDNSFGLEKTKDLRTEDILSSGGLASNDVGATQSSNNSIRNNGENINPKLSIVDKTGLTKEELADKYGTIKIGENPSREVSVPKKTGKKKVVSKFARTLEEAGATTDEMLELLDESIEKEDFSYTPVSNEKYIDEAYNIFNKKGIKGLEAVWESAMSRNKPLSADEIAIGEYLYNEYVKEERYDEALDLAIDLTTAATRAGRAVQSFRILKKLTPQGQLFALQRLVQSLQKDLDIKYDSKAPKIEINEDLAKKLLEAADKVSVQEAVEKIKQNIADQIPATWIDKINAWRYLAMLGNPRTHIRNIVGNSVFFGARQLKNLVLFGLERTLPKEQRTKAFINPIKDKHYIERAKQIYEENKDILAGNDKYDRGDIEKRKTVFKTKWLEALRKANFKALEFMDEVFFKKAFISSVAQELKAKGVILEEETITANMKEEERAKILNRSVITMPDSITGSRQDKDIVSLEREKNKNTAKEMLKKIGEKEGIFGTKLKNNLAGIEFVFSKKKSKESTYYQVENYDDIGLAYKNLKSIAENAVLIEMHEDKYKDTIRENKDLKNVYVLMSAYTDGEYIVPVLLEVKEFSNRGNSLHIIVSTNKIKTEVSTTATVQRPSSVARSVNISIAEIARKINEKNGRILKYFPDSMLNESQKIAKKDAIKEENIKIERLRRELEEKKKKERNKKKEKPYDVSKVSKEYLDAVDDKILKFANHIEKEGIEGVKPVELNPPSERAIEDIKNILGRDVSDFKTKIEARQMQHILNDHGKNGAANHSMADNNDIARMQYIIDNYDNMEDGGFTDAYKEPKRNGKNRIAPTVCIKKKVDGTYYIVEAVPNAKAKTLFVVSAYIEKNKNDQQFGDVVKNAPPYTSDTGSADHNITISNKKAESKKKRGRKLTPKLEQEIIERAKQEALKAVFRDTSSLADALNKFKRTNKIAAVIGEGLFPFTKTPVNVLKRGMEYSPIWLVKGLADRFSKVKKGKMTATQALDEIAEGLTGTGILLLGVFLAKMGILSAGDDEDKNVNTLGDMSGKQNYALNIGDVSYTIDWMSPIALPLFIGAEIHKTIETGNPEASFANILDSVTKISEPLFNLSMLQSINNSIEAVKYSEGSPFTEVIINIVTNYAGQFVPSLLGQFARVFDDTQRVSYYQPESPLPKAVDSLIQGVQKKTPVLNRYLQPYVDRWGREVKTGSIGERIFENFASPGYLEKDKSTNVDKEIDRLYKQIGESAVIPPVAGKTIQTGEIKKNLTAKEHTEYSKTLGQGCFDAASKVIDNKAYNSLTDREKVKAIDLAYDYAMQLAKSKMLPKYEPDKWVLKADADKENLGLYLIAKGAMSERDITKNGEKIDFIDNMKIDADSRYMLYERFVLGEETIEKFSEAQKAGISKGQLVDIYSETYDMGSYYIGEDVVSNTKSLRIKDVIDKHIKATKQREITYSVFGVSAKVAAGNVTWDDVDISGATLKGAEGEEMSLEEETQHNMLSGGETGDTIKRIGDMGLSTDEKYNKYEEYLFSDSASEKYAEAQALGLTKKQIMDIYANTYDIGSYYENGKAVSNTKSLQLKDVIDEHVADEDKRAVAYATFGVGKKVARGEVTWDDVDISNATLEKGETEDTSLADEIKELLGIETSGSGSGKSSGTKKNKTSSSKMVDTSIFDVSKGSKYKPEAIKASKYLKAFDTKSGKQNTISIEDVVKAMLDNPYYTAEMKKNARKLAKR